MKTIELTTHLTFDQLLASLRQLSPEQLTQLSVATTQLQADPNTPIDNSTLLSSRRTAVVSQWQQLDVTNWNTTQLAAYKRTLAALQSPDASRQRGLAVGLIATADDFDAPLTQSIENLFWGSETDKFGMIQDSNP